MRVLEGQLDLLTPLAEEDPDLVAEVWGEPVFEPIVSAGQERLDFEIVKPAYRVPSMREIEAVEPNGYRIVSTFSGCGGSCLGFRMAGFRTLFASEFVPAAVDTYLANHPGVPVAIGDVRDLEPEMILASLDLRRGELDVLEGSPPCSSFSMAGKREDGWGEIKKYSDVRQRTDDLFFEFVRLVDGLLPRVVVAENVPGLLAGDAVDYFNTVSRSLNAIGYVLWADVLNAAWFGVPQNRRRVIIVAVRRDLEVQPAFPRRLPYGYSIRDAIGVPEGSWLRMDGADVNPVLGVERPAPTITSDGISGRYVGGSKQHGYLEIPGVPDGSMNGTRIGGENALVPADGPAPTITANGIGGRSNRGANDSQMVHLPGAADEASIERYAIGEEWEKLAPGESSERYFNLVRPDPEKPSPTITQTGGDISAASVTHPTEKRKFTIAELRRLCSFPDDFILTGTWGQQWERLGRAVPPLMMRAVAETVRDEILRRADGLAKEDAA